MRASQIRLDQKTVPNGIGEDLILDTAVFVSNTWVPKRVYSLRS